MITLQEMAVFKKVRSQLNIFFVIRHPPELLPVSEPCMSPVSPVFHTLVTLKIGLKTQLEWEHQFHQIR